MRLNQREKGGFTLVELLVVIAIIGILAGVVLMGFTSVTDKANQAKATAGAKSVVEAWMTYKIEYKRWPLTSNGSLGGSSPTGENSGMHAEEGTGLTMNKWPTEMLMGDKGVGTGGGRSYNPNESIFLELNVRALGDGRGEFGTQEGEGLLRDQYVDPWNHAYKFKLDANKDQKIKRFQSNDGLAPNESPYIYEEVIAWSVGVNGKDATRAQAEDDANSW